MESKTPNAPILFRELAIEDRVSELEERVKALEAKAGDVKAAPALATKKTPTVLPTLEEVAEHCRAENIDVDPEMFYYFYEAKDWMIGKNKMVKWKAAIRTWEKGRDQTERLAKKTLSEFEINHGTTNFATGEFLPNTRLCRDERCEACSEARARSAGELFDG